MHMELHMLYTYWLLSQDDRAGPGPKSSWPVRLIGPARPAAVRPPAGPPAWPTVRPTDRRLYLLSSRGISKNPSCFITGPSWHFTWGISSCPTKGKCLHITRTGRRGYCAWRHYSYSTRARSPIVQETYIYIYCEYMWHHILQRRYVTKQNMKLHAIKALGQHHQARVTLYKGGKLRTMYFSKLLTQSSRKGLDAKMWVQA
jgi:hypothetical protein